MGESEIVQVQPSVCPNCLTATGPKDRFCPSCGKSLSVAAEQMGSTTWTHLGPMLWFYFSQLVVLIFFAVLDAESEFLELIVFSVVYVVLIVIFWVPLFNQLKPLFSLSRVKFKMVAVVILLAGFFAIVVNFVANALNVAIHDNTPYMEYKFEDTSNPLLFSILFVCVYPGIFEEVAFRGIMCQMVKPLTSVRNTVYLTGFLFGILHFSLISLLWLFPIGALFALWRFKYRTLWYGMIGHFCYNLTIVLLENFEAVSL